MTLFVPLLPGRVEQWRRFLQTLQSSALTPYIASRRRLGIVAEQVWIVETQRGETAVVFRELDPDLATPAEALETTLLFPDAFDRRFQEIVSAVQGVEQTVCKANAERLFCWPKSAQNCRQADFDE